MPRSLADRVAVLESQMQLLQELPGQVAALGTRVASLESQFLQFRAEVKDQFLATRRELGGEIGGLRGEVDGLRGELAAVAAGLREEIRTGLDDTRRYMRMLHEQVRADIKTIRDK